MVDTTLNERFQFERRSHGVSPSHQQPTRVNFHIFASRDRTSPRTRFERTYMFLLRSTRVQNRQSQDGYHRQHDHGVHSPKPRNHPRRTSSLSPATFRPPLLHSTKYTTPLPPCG